MATTCLSTSCRWRPPGECVYYSGENIPSYSITNGDNLNVIIQKITSHVSSGGAVTETPNTVTDSNSINLTASGSLNRTIQADLRLDAQAGNKLTVGVAGVYSAPATFVASYNSGTGVLTLNIDGTPQTVTLSGAVTTVFGRNGAVTAQSGDYTFAQIGSKPTTIAGYNITDPIVYTSGSYADPAWITSLAKSKVSLGNVDDTSDANKPVSTAQLTALNLKANLASPALTGTPTAPTAANGTNTTQLATTAFVLAQIAAVSSGVTTFNTRSGIVVAATNDYTWAQINKTTSSFLDITTRSATDISSGTLADVRLSNNVPLLSANNTFTGTMTLSNLAGAFSGIVRATTAGLLSSQTPAGLKTDLILVKADVGLSNIPNVDATVATNITTGTLPDGRLSANVPLLNTANTFTTDQAITGNFSVSGTITNTALTSSLALKAPLASPALTGVPTTPTAGANTNNTQIASTAYADAAVTAGLATISVATDVLLTPSDINSTSASYVDVTGLSFPVVAGGFYRFRFHITFLTAATTTGTRWSINGPAATFIRYHSQWTLDANTVSIFEGLTSYNLPAAANASSLTVGNIAIIEGTIIPSANGTVIARMASGVGGSNIAANANRSYVTYKKLN